MSRPAKHSAETEAAILAALAVVLVAWHDVLPPTPIERIA